MRAAIGSETTSPRWCTSRAVPDMLMTTKWTRERWGAAKSERARRIAPYIGEPSSLLAHRLRSSEAKPTWNWDETKKKRTNGNRRGRIEEAVWRDWHPMVHDQSMIRRRGCPKKSHSGDRWEWLFYAGLR